MSDVPPDSGKLKQLEDEVRVAMLEQARDILHIEACRYSIARRIRDRAVLRGMPSSIARTADPPPDPGREARVFAAKVLREEAERLDEMSKERHQLADVATKNDRLRHRGDALAYDETAALLRARADELDPPPDPGKV